MQHVDEPQPLVDFVPSGAKRQTRCAKYVPAIPETTKCCTEGAGQGRANCKRRMGANYTDDAGRCCGTSTAVSFWQTITVSGRKYLKDLVDEGSCGAVSCKLSERFCPAAKLYELYKNKHTESQSDRCNQSEGSHKVKSDSTWQQHTIMDWE